MYGYDESSVFHFDWESVTNLCAADRGFKAITTLRRLRPNALLLDPTKPLNDLAVILDGCVHVESFDTAREPAKNERRKLFALPFTTGAVLCTDLFTGWQAYRVKAVEPTVICHLDADLEYVGENWSEVLEALLRSQIEVQQRLYDEQLEAYEPVRTRLVRLLWRESNSGHRTITMSHRAIAERLGTYRETVSNQLARLKHSGVIDYGYRAISVLDVDRLNHLTLSYHGSL